jgi:hypothetical protein
LVLRFMLLNPVREHMINYFPVIPAKAGIQ